MKIRSLNVLRVKRRSNAHSSIHMKPLNGKKRKKKKGTGEKNPRASIALHLSHYLTASHMLITRVTFAISLFVHLSAGCVSFDLTLDFAQEIKHEIKRINDPQTDK